MKRAGLRHKAGNALEENLVPRALDSRGETRHRTNARLRAGAEPVAAPETVVEPARERALA